MQMKYTSNLRVIVKNSIKDELSSKIDKALSELGCFIIEERICKEYWKDKSCFEIVYQFEKSEIRLSDWKSLFENVFGSYSLDSDDVFTQLEHFDSLANEKCLFAVLNIPNALILK